MYESINHIRVQLNNGEEYILQKGCIVKPVCACTHGDWKTALAKGYPTIPAYTELEVVGWFRNFYGIWITVLYRGITYDLSPKNLLYVRKDN